MAPAFFQHLDDEIICIDALYTGPENACCYLVGGAGEYALVETGTARSVANILATLNALEIDPARLRYVIPTHVHLDHAGGCGQLMARFPDATLLVHPRGARHLVDPARLVASSQAVYGEQLFSELYGEILPVPAERVQTLDDGGTVELGRRRLKVRHTRGHANHHLCLFDEQSGGWFSGDMFGISYPRLRFPSGAFVIPATTPTQFDPELYAQSVSTLAAAGPRQFFLTHYGALPFADEQVNMLHRQLADYAALADHSGATTDTLAASVTAIAEREIARLVGAQQARAAAAALHMDARLNAQGIAWWRDSRSPDG